MRIFIHSENFKLALKIILESNHSEFMNKKQLAI